MYIDLTFLQILYCYKYVKVREITFTSGGSEAVVKYHIVTKTQRDDKLRGGMVTEV